MATAARQVQNPQQKQITVILSGTTVQANPERVRLKVSENQEAIWCCDSGDFEILFDSNDTPFHGHHWTSPKGGGCCSGVPLAGTNRDRPYKYTVRVKDSRGNWHENDPEVAVDP